MRAVFTANRVLHPSERIAIYLASNPRTATLKKEGDCYGEQIRFYARGMENHRRRRSHGRTRGYLRQPQRAMGRDERNDVHGNGDGGNVAEGWLQSPYRGAGCRSKSKANKTRAAAGH